MSTNLNDLATFVRVAELGTFSAAAAAEGVPKSTISRRIARLENALGIELLRRSSRSFSLTDEGRVLHARTIGALREFEDATNKLTEQPGEPRGKLVITAPADLGTSTIVADLLADYSHRYPDVTLEVRLLNRFVDLIAEDVDVALRVHTTPIVPGEGNLIVRKLGTLQAALYAAPDYLENHSALEAPQDLMNHVFVLHDAHLNASVTLLGENGSKETLNVGEIKTTGNSMFLVSAMLERGMGVGLLPRFVAKPMVEQGRLVRLLPNWWSRASKLSLLWPSSRHLALRVHAFVEMACQELVGPWMCVE